MKTKDGVEFVPGMMLYFASQGQAHSFDSKPETCITSVLLPTVPGYYAHERNAIKEAIAYRRVVMRVEQEEIDKLVDRLLDLPSDVPTGHFEPVFT